MPLVTEIGLVACSQLKRRVDIAPARSLYSSPLFRKSAAYAEQRCQRWYILSAKHGLLWPNQLVMPYDHKLDRTGTATWDEMILGQLRKELADTPSAHLIVLAGEQYRGFLSLHEWPYEVPMQGLGIGQQLKWLTDQLGGAKTL